MPRPRSARPDDALLAFLVERYVSPAAAVGLAALASEVAELCADSAGVRYLSSAYLPAEDTCFCLFRAPSSDAVRAINRRAGFALDRITPAVLLQGDHHDQI